MLIQETSKKGHFFQKLMYAHTLERVSKTAKFARKRVCFSTRNCNMCLGYKTHSRDKNEKGYTYSTMHYLLV